MRTVRIYAVAPKSVTDGMSSLLRLKLLLWALSLTHSFGDKCTVESMLSLASLRKKSDVKPEALTFYLPLGH
jgi:hypothetical protein